jgi:OOP family OmpA-OmpF porin
MAQNLVPNPSFEIFDTCPNELGQIEKAIGWYSAKPSPDYFNFCAPSNSLNNVSIPYNFWGYQTPASGNAYAGFAAMYGGVSNSREFIGVKLLDSLHVGETYYASFKICRAFNSNFSNDCSVNKIGILFSTIKYTDVNNPMVCNCSQIYTDTIVKDTLNWTTIKGAFVADSTYSFINIGNFFTNNVTDSIQVEGSFCNAYYYLDDVCLSTDSIYAYTYTPTSLKELINQKYVTHFPNPTKDVTTIQSEEMGIEQVKIYTVLGAHFQTFNLNSVKSYVLDLRDTPRGNYYVTVHFTDSTSSKFIVSKL